MKIDSNKALAMVWELEKFSQKLRAIKTRPAWQVEAEERLARRLQEMFDGVFDNVVREFQSIGRVPSDSQTRRQILRFFADAQENMTDLTSKEAAAIAQRGRNSVIARLQRQGISISYDEVPFNILDMTRNRIFEASARTMERINGNVMEVLANCYEQGLSIYDTMEELRNVFTNIRDHELRTIARTEIIGTNNLAAYLTQLELGVEYHMWITAEDDRVRGAGPHDEADHIILHGQIVRVGEPFSNGLLYPGDRSGPISEWINCRCREVPFLMPEGYMAPPGRTYFTEDELVPLVV